MRERRAARRLRTRLRPGKLLDLGFGFLADCAILDRTQTGLRIRHFGDLQTAGDHLAVFDEKDGTVRSGRIIWRRQGEAGIRLDAGAPSAIDPKVLGRLRAPYYAVAD